MLADGGSQHEKPRTQLQSCLNSRFQIDLKTHLVLIEDKTDLAPEIRKMFDLRDRENAGTLEPGQNCVQTAFLRPANEENLAMAEILIPISPFDHQCALVNRDPGGQVVQS